MLPKAKTVYFHVDVNSAFLSWTAIQHLANGETLDLRTVPAVVGGDEEKRHGVVLAKSISRQTVRHPNRGIAVYGAQQIPQFDRCRAGF